MEKITSLVNELKNNAARLPHLHSLTLKKGELFSWNHTACAILYNPNIENAQAYLLHEYCHALLGHHHYEHDIDLIKLERAAWDKAVEMSQAYGIVITEDTIETALDSYRDWLHNRSLCPHCGATGIETASHEYSCPACGTVWHVNEARTCALRRYTKKRP